MFYIQSGKVRLIVVAKEGKECTLGLLNPGDFFGEGCLAGQTRRMGTKPCPVTLPIRALIICTAAMSGQVRSAVQRSLVPSCAPATEYVAIPEGSSSAAPVITLGPRDFSSNRIHRAGANFGIRGETSLWLHHSAAAFRLGFHVLLFERPQRRRPQLWSQFQASSEAALSGNRFLK